MPEFSFKGTAKWRGETESDLIIKDKNIVTVSPPPEFGGKQGYIVPEEVFAASLASCMNTIFLLVAKNSELALKTLETKADVKMNVEGLEKLVFTHIAFEVTVKLEKDDEWNRKKANSVLGIAERICPLRQSWGEKVPITFKLNFQ